MLFRFKKIRTVRLPTFLSISHRRDNFFLKRTWYNKTSKSFLVYNPINLKTKPHGKRLVLRGYCKNSNLQKPEELEKFLSEHGKGLIDLSNFFTQTEAELVKYKLEKLETYMPTDLIVIPKSLDSGYSLWDWFDEYHRCRGRFRVIYIVNLKDLKNSGFHLGDTVRTAPNKKAFDLSDLVDKDTQSIKQSIYGWLDHNIQFIEKDEKKNSGVFGFLIFGAVVLILGGLSIYRFYSISNYPESSCKVCYNQMVPTEDEKVIRTVLTYGERCERWLTSKKFIVLICPRCWNSQKDKGSSFSVLSNEVFYGDTIPLIKKQEFKYCPICEYKTVEISTNGVEYCHCCTYAV